MAIDVEKVRQALERLNYLRAPKITAKLISIKDDCVTVDFNGFSPRRCLLHSGLV
ncbi:MAG: hypothetical protein J7L98_04205 [Candidatus Verstraetearchaeota archaeon]|nr:hypothetical protein [Candidatus Verstraetearchaeota archaeon]